MKIKLDTRDFGKQIRRLGDLTGKGLREVLKEQAGLLASDAMRFTPPFASAPITERMEVQYEAGARAIFQDLFGGRSGAWTKPKAGIFVVLNDAEVATGQKAVRKSGNRLIFAKKDGSVYGVDDWHWKVGASITELLRHHEENRSKRTGRVTSAGATTRDVGRWRFLNKFVISQNQFDSVYGVLKGSIGIAKAGWVKAIRATRKGKTSIPPWIARHGRSIAGGIYAEGGTTEKPVFIVGNAVPFAQKFADHVETRAWKNRLRNLPRQIAGIERALQKKAQMA